MQELHDLRQMMDSPPPSGRGIPGPPTEEEVQRCIQTLLYRQFIYTHQQKQYGGVLKFLTESYYQSFFRKYFAAMGFEFIHDRKSGMVGLKVAMDAKRVDRGGNLKKDETQTLLLLRLLYEEGYSDGRYTPRGEVEVSTDTILDRIDFYAKMDVGEGRLGEILQGFKSRGLVNVGDVDPEERTRTVTIYPGIEHVTSEAYIQKLENQALDRVAAVREAALRVAAMPEQENDNGVEERDDSQESA